jgi:predicted HicB family RNase H-like nuclease
MAKKRLSKKLKAQIDKSPFRVKKSELSDSAREYLEKARVARRKEIVRDREKSYIRVGELLIPYNSEMGQIVSKSAEAKKMSVNKYVKTYKEEIKRLAEKGSTHTTREVDYLIKDMNVAPKIFVNGNEVSKTKAKFYLQNFKNTFVNEGEVYPIVNIEHAYNLQGELFINFPLPDEYENFSTEYSSDEDESEDTAKESGGRTQLVRHWRKFVSTKYPKIMYIPND